MVIGSLTGGFVTGIFLGLILALAFNWAMFARKTKRECRECLRTRVKYGFQVDGKEYRCIEKQNLNGG